MTNAATEQTETLRGEVVGANRRNRQSTSRGAGTEWSSPFFAVRLHLIRHGETEANANYIVLGQTDSVSVSLLFFCFR